MAISDEEIKQKILGKIECLNAGGNKPCLEYVIIELLDVLNDDKFSTWCFERLEGR